MKAGSKQNISTTAGEVFNIMWFEAQIKNTITNRKSTTKISPVMKTKTKTETMKSVGEPEVW
jgi:hypothetical protein